MAGTIRGVRILGAVVLLAALGTVAAGQTINLYAGNGVQGFAGDGTAAPTASLNRPYQVATDSAGNVYIADYGNHRVRKVDATTGNITTVAGTGITGYNG